MTKPSIAQRVQETQAQSGILGVGFVQGKPCYVLNEEAAIVGDETLNLHSGAILDCAFSENTLLTGGDDGRVRLLESEVTTLYEEKGKWVDKVLLGAGFAFSVGKTVFFGEKRDKLKTLSLPSSASGLAFAPKGVRLAISHYNGVSLWYPNLTTPPEVLEWKGSHLGVVFSPDGRFVVSSMQEPQLHGWRLSDKKDMKMSGYPFKVRALAWTHKGAYLASSGAHEAILWPFTGKNGPMGENPLMVGGGVDANASVTSVAAHPQANVIAVGFSDGLLTMVRLPDGAEVLIRNACEDEITSITWRKDGKALLFGTANGKCGYVEI
jgi:WD40 repeat protein